MDFNVKIKEKIYNIRIYEKAKKSVSIKVGGKSYSFDEIESKTEAACDISEFGRQQKILCEKEIKASIAGEISEIFVKDGASVKNGQKILTLLAMKMENEIISELDGKVKRVLVKPSQIVSEGEVLVVFE